MPNEPFRPNPVADPAAFHPLLTLWAMPWIMGQAWLAACLSTTTRSDEKARNPKGEGQLPVPVVLQDTKDKQLFA